MAIEDLNGITLPIPHKRVFKRCFIVCMARSDSGEREESFSLRKVALRVQRMRSLIQTPSGECQTRRLTSSKAIYFRLECIR